MTAIAELFKVFGACSFFLLLLNFQDIKHQQQIYYVSSFDDLFDFTHNMIRVGCLYEVFYDLLARIYQEKYLPT